MDNPAYMTIFNNHKRGSKNTNRNKYDISTTNVAKNKLVTNELIQQISTVTTQQ